MKATIGLEVHVFSPDKNEDWGLGKIIDVGDGPFESTAYPTLKLDDGRILKGLDCWWSPIKDDEETPCLKREDGLHCVCWYDSEPCCSCGEE